MSDSPFAGRPWGEAGDSATSSLRILNDGIRPTTRIHREIRASRRILPFAPPRARRTSCGSRKLRHRASRASLRDVLDPSFGVPQDPPSLSDVRAFIDAVPGPADITWDIEVDDRAEVDRRTHDCFDNFESGQSPSVCIAATSLSLHQSTTARTSSALSCRAIPTHLQTLPST